MSVHRSFRTLAITRNTIALIALIILVCSFSPARAQRTFRVEHSSKKDSPLDTGNLKAFDALPIAQQIKSLLKYGPRTESQRSTSDVKIRGLIDGSSYILFQYGLPSDAFAELTISVPGIDPLVTRIEPAPQAQIKIAIPANYGSTARVASLYIKARTKGNEPAKIQIYELAMERDRAPDIRKAHALRSSAQLSINTDGPADDNEPLPLFDPSPVPMPPGVQINVSPSTIKAGTQPPMVFSFKVQSNYSGSRCEFWRLTGWNTTIAWQQKTGPVKPQKTWSGSWNGIGSNQKNSLGAHFLELVLWNGREKDYNWVVADTDPNLFVIK